MSPSQLIRPELLTFDLMAMQGLLAMGWVTLGSLLTVILTVIGKQNNKLLVFLSALLFLGLGASSSWQLLDSPPEVYFNGMILVSPMVHFFNIVFCLAAIGTLAASYRYLDLEALQLGEYYALVMFATLGMMLMISSNDLVVFFISLELMSLAVYTLVGFRRADRKSNEASLKYFILGGAASAVFLYGVALSYGVISSTRIPDLLKFYQATSEIPRLLNLGSAFMLVGFLFKVASVPFHMWMPDVYEGAPVPITGFMTTGLKAAVFVSFIRVLEAMNFTNGSETGFSHTMHNVIWVCAVATMILGNVIALTQTNLKRLLAYSSIGHTGYLMVGILAASGTNSDFSSVVLYLVSYVIMNLGAFVILTVLSGRGDSGLMLHDLSGLSKNRPWLAAGFAVFMLSMAGIPPTAGFMAKYYLFYSAVQSNEVPLVIIAVLCSAVSVYYYLRVLVYMYMKEPAAAGGNPRTSVWAGVTIALLVLLTLQVGTVPRGMVDSARRVVASSK